MGLLGCALTWLAWQVLDQDRQLASQRSREKLEQASNAISFGFELAMAELDASLRIQMPTEDAVLLRIRQERGNTRVDADQLLYLPPPRPRADAGAGIFEEGERLEFVADNPAAAADFFRVLSASANPDTRAGALLRLARNQRKLGLHQEALATYDRLASIRNCTIDEIPVELIALSARCSLLETLHRPDDLHRSALRMKERLVGARWALPGASWDLHWLQVRRYAPDAQLMPREITALAASRVAEWICLRAKLLEPRGRRILIFDGSPVLTSWEVLGDQVVTIVMPTSSLQSLWNQVQVGQGVNAALLDVVGSVLLGSSGANSPGALRVPAPAVLPGSMVLTPIDSPASESAVAVRRRFLVAGFAVLALILAAGTYFILRSMQRERAVARLQSEFVAAVSHEFRTPLASLRQFSEMLANDRIAGEPEKRAAYGLMVRASERLQRLVESLLDLGRMEAASFRYRTEPVDVAALAERVVDEFRMQIAGQGRDVSTTQRDPLPAVQGDSDALGIALWNLLDNAAQYSPERKPIRVELRSENGEVAIAVEDEGLGIAEDEQKQVFQKFVRGAAARQSNARGIGIGLSMTQHIVAAHGGTISVRSVLNHGSTFTITLPAETRE